MTKRLLVFVFIFVFALLRANAQNTLWVYDFGTAAVPPYTSTTYSSGYLPAPQPSGGTAGVRASSATEGPVELVTTGIAGGTGAELKITGGVTTSGTKFGISSYNGSPVGTFGCKLNFTSGTNGRFVLFFGNGSNFTNGNGINNAQTFAALRFSPGTSNVTFEWLATSAGYSTSGLTQTSLAKNQVYNLRLFMNNSNTNATYTTSNGTVLNNLAAGTFDVWLDNTKILTNADPGSGLLAQPTTINSFNLAYSVIGSSAPVMYIDDINYSNFLPNTNLAPVVSLTAPANNASFTSPATVNINASAADADGLVSKVEFFEGTNKLGEALTAPYNFTWNNVMPGNYSITAKATDNAGAITTSTAVNISAAVHNDLPTVSITSPVNNASFTSPATINITADAADTDGTITKVEFYNGANKLGEASTAPYTFTWSNAVSGNYTITARATDDAGAVVTSSAVNVSVAGTGPLSALETKYRNWLLDAAADYSNAQVLARYNSFIDAGTQAKNLTGYDLSNPGPVWNFRSSNADEDAYTTLVEQKLIRLVFLYQLKGPATNPNADYHSAALRDLILNIFNYIKAKGVSSSTDFVIDETPATESVDINNSVALRSSSFATSIFLMKDELKAAGVFNYHMGTLQALTYFIDPTFAGFNFTYPGFNTDVQRVSTQQRLCYVLSQDDTSSNRLANMDHLRKFINNALNIGRGWSDCIKPDFVTFHHRGVYSNTYGLNALQQMSIMNMILKGSPYELDASSAGNLKQALMNYNKFCKGFEMPRGIGGRFPFDTDPENDVRPAYVYLYMADPAGNEDAAREFVRLWGISASANNTLQSSSTVSINMIYTVSGMQNIVDVLNAGLSALPERMEGQFNFPYAGLSVHKYNGYQVTMKGTSKYVWNYESSSTENIYGRYGSAGSMEILAVGNPLTHDTNGYTENGWDWSRNPGVTAAYIPLSVIGSGTARLFSGKSFLGHASLDNNGMFAMDYRDANSTTLMTGKKTVFFFKDKLLCMGSGFNNTGGTYPIQTTLFQTVLATTNTSTYVNGNEATGTNYSFSQQGGGFWATDAVGHGYVVPASAANADSITVIRSVQNSRNNSNTANTTGNFATAYINHGIAPANAKYVYGVTIQGGQSGTQDFANNFDSYFKVLQQDSAAHIVQYVPDSTYGYAIFNPAATFNYDLTLSVDKPAVVMTQKLDNGNKVKLSLTNPDLGLLASNENYTFNQITSNPAILYRTSPVVVITLTIAGKWMLENPGSNISAAIAGDSTKITFSTVNGFTIQTSLVKASLNVIARSDANKYTSDSTCAYIAQGSEFDMSATSNCGGNTYNYALTGATTASGNNTLNNVTFNKGTTLVTWTVKDACNDSVASSFNVFVADTTKPIIAVTNITVNNDSAQCSKTLTLSQPIATDNCAVASVTNNAPTSFPVGSTNVTWTATDSSGNSTSAVQTVTVQDAEAPAVTNPASQNLSWQASGNYSIPELTASDNCGIDSVSYVITGATNRSGSGTNASGSFNTGSSTINWKVKDVHNNVSTATQSIHISGTADFGNVTVFAGVTNSDNNGRHVDLLAELYLNGSLIGSGSLLNQPVSGISLNNSSKYQIPVNVSKISYNETDQVQLKLSVRRTSGGNFAIKIWQNVDSATAASKGFSRMWKNTPQGSSGNYFYLRDGFLLDQSAGNTATKILLTATGTYQEVGTWSTDTNNQLQSVTINNAQSTDRGPQLVATVYPNPSASVFKILVQSSNEEMIQVRVYDVQGRLITAISSPNKTIQFGNEIQKGIYFAQIKQGQQTVVVKLIKL
jgi:hypothetical protein